MYKELFYNKLSFLFYRWETLIEQACLREVIIDEVAEVAHAHSIKTLAFSLWLSQPEKSYKELELVPTTREEVLHFKKAVKHFTINIEAHKCNKERVSESLLQLKHILDKHPQVIGKEIRKYQKYLTFLTLLQ